MKEKIVLAFSGGLDTSFCIPYLLERNYEVHTLFVDTGGTPDNEKQAISDRAAELGSTNHLNVNIDTFDSSGCSLSKQISRSLL